MESIMDTEAPIKTICISGKRRFVKPWITKGLETASQKNRKLYRKTIDASCTESDIAAYKAQRNMLNRLHRTTKMEYYTTKSHEYRRNTRKLWSLINNTINKCKNSGSIISFNTVDGLKTYNPLKIANGFGHFYSMVGKNLVDAITPGKHDINHYLKMIPRTTSSLVIRETSVEEIEKIIKLLPHKTSYGHDEVSNTLLKLLSTSISYPLQVIFTQSIYQDVFPDKMKLAEIVPLYKGKEYDLIINYRPISLLMTISKVLEKNVYHCLYSFLELNGTLFESQYGFSLQRSCEQAILEMVGNLLQTHSNGLFSSGTFLDLSKAFDTLNHNVLIRNCMEYVD